jgi:hypothetical protein
VTAAFALTLGVQPGLLLLQPNVRAPAQEMWQLQDASGSLDNIWTDASVTFHKFEFAIIYRYHGGTLYKTVFAKNKGQCFYTTIKPSR